MSWSALPEEAIDNALKDNRNWLQARVSANGENFKHVMWQFVNQILIVIFN